jgi:hypothetical protein
MEDAMSRIGLNHHLTVAKTLRQQTRTLYEGVLGASVMSPRAATEIFRFANGSRIGVSYVEPSEALTPEQHLKAIWLEFEVEEEETTAAELEALECGRSNISTRHTSTFRRPAGECSVWPNSNSPHTRRRLIFGSEKAVRF